MGAVYERFFTVIRCLTRQEFRSECRALPPGRSALFQERSKRCLKVLRAKFLSTKLLWQKLHRQKREFPNSFAGKTAKYSSWETAENARRNFPAAPAISVQTQIGSIH